MLKAVKLLVRIFFCILVVNQAQADMPPDTYSLTLEWNPSPSPEIIGGHLYYGTVSGQYTNTVVVGNVTTVTVEGLLFDVTYYFAITAIDSDGQESDFSNETSYRKEAVPQNNVPQIHLRVAQMQIRSATDGRCKLTIKGPPRNNYNVEATEDLTTWTVINTVTLDDTGSQEFTDMDASNYPQRFYRLHETPF